MRIATKPGRLDLPGIFFFGLRYLTYYEGVKT